MKEISLALLLLISLPNLITGEESECLVESNICSFPFQVEEDLHYGCVEDSDGSNPDRYYCKVQLGEKYVTGICNGGCFDDDQYPLEFNSTLDAVASFFCKTKASACQFPFIWNDKDYSSCTKDGDSPFEWCALEVDENRNLLKNRWAKCDMSTCSNIDTVVEELPEPRQIQVHFSEFSGEILLEQLSSDEAIQFSGHLEGLPDSNLELALVPSPCDQPPNIDLITTIQSLTTNDINTDLWSKSLFPGDHNNIAGYSLIVKEENAAVPQLDDEGSLQLGRILACTPIQESSGISLTYIIIIILAALVVFLILALVIIVCCCCRRNRKEKTYKEACSIDDDEPFSNGNSKIPLYDELSIPFIDASLPPTPKMGRSTDQLAILLGKGSRSSLSREEA